MSQNGNKDDDDTLPEAHIGIHIDNDSDDLETPLKDNSFQSLNSDNGDDRGETNDTEGANEREKLVKDDSSVSLNGNGDINAHKQSERTVKTAVGDGDGDMNDEMDEEGLYEAFPERTRKSSSNKVWLIPVIAIVILGSIGGILWWVIPTYIMNKHVKADPAATEASDEFLAPSLSPSLTTAPSSEGSNKTALMSPSSSPSITNTVKITSAPTSSSAPTSYPSNAPSASMLSSASMSPTSILSKVDAHLQVLRQYSPNLPSTVLEYAELANDTSSWSPQMFALSMGLISSSPTDPDFVEQYAIQTLYAATGFNWTINENLIFADSCSWYGVICDDNSTIIGLNLEGSNLVGSVPSEIRILTGLRELKLAGNQLGDVMPWEAISGLTDLEVLNVSRNNLEGNLIKVGMKKWWSGLEKLVSLSISHNNFTGELLPKDDLPPNLESFHFESNGFVGDIPNSYCDSFDFMADCQSDFPLNCTCCSQEQKEGFCYDEVGEMTQAPSIQPTILLGPNTPPISSHPSLSTTPSSIPSTSPMPSVSVSVRPTSSPLDMWTLAARASKHLPALLPYSPALPATVLEAQAQMNDPTRHTPQLFALGNMIQQHATLNVTHYFEQYALLVLAYSTMDPSSVTSSPSWTNFMGWWNMEDPCSWYGVTCSEETNEIIKLDLNNNNLVGTIPGEIHLLSDLKILTLQKNKLGGQPPWTELSKLTKLELLDLRDNQLSGKIVDGFASMEKLDELLLSNNQFTGLLPDDSKLPASLETFTFESNSFTESDIPDIYCQRFVFTADCKDDVPLNCTCCTEDEKASRCQ